MTAVMWIKSNKALTASLAFLAACLIVWAGWLLAMHLGAKREGAKRDAAQAAAVGKAVTLDAGVKEVLAEERQRSAVELERLNRQLKEADDHEADNLPSPARVAVLCGIMRAQAGGRVSDLPARCRP